MKNLFLILFFLACGLSFGQNANPPVSETGKGLSDAEFTLAKELYLKMSQSEIYITNREATIWLNNRLGDFRVNSIEDMDFLKTDESYSKWITENFRTTKFKDLDEAIALRKLCIDSQAKMMAENTKVYEFISRATIDQNVEILKPDRPTYPEIQRQRQRQ